MVNQTLINEVVKQMDKKPFDFLTLCVLIFFISLLVILLNHYRKREPKTKALKKE